MCCAVGSPSHFIAFLSLPLAVGCVTLNTENCLFQIVISVRSTALGLGIESHKEKYPSFVNGKVKNKKQPILI